MHNQILKWAAVLLVGYFAMSLGITAALAVIASSTWFDVTVIQPIMSNIVSGEARLTVLGLFNFAWAMLVITVVYIPVKIWQNYATSVFSENF